VLVGQIIRNLLSKTVVPARPVDEALKKSGQIGQESQIAVMANLA
jgi:hypothetical protein